MVRHDVMIKYFRVMGSEGVVDWREWVKILRDNETMSGADGVLLRSTCPSTRSAKSLRA